MININGRRAELLDILNDNVDSFISGQQICEILGITRSAVWQHVKELRSAGYQIESVTNKGYKLCNSSDVFNSYEVGQYLNTEFVGRDIEFYEKIDSTNDEAHKLAVNGCKDGLTIVSDVQTKGRGRFGRNWASSGGKGIWTSVVLRPKLRPQDVGLITLAVAIAVIDAIKVCTGIEAFVKWPNDIIIDNKKVCGILTEMSTDPDRINFIVIGIGLNVAHRESDFSKELRNKATSLKVVGKEDYSRSKILGVLLNEIERIYNILCSGDNVYIINAWKERSLIFDKKISYYSNNLNGSGYAKEINDDGNLIVESYDGSQVILRSGEVSVRGVMGYNE